MTKKQAIRLIENNIRKNIELYETEDGAVFGGVDGLDMFDVTSSKVIFHCITVDPKMKTVINFKKATRDEVRIFMQQFI